MRGRMQPRNGWARVVSGAELQKVANVGNLNPNRQLVCDLTAGVDYGEGERGAPDACWEVYWDVIDHGSGGQDIVADPNFLLVWESAGDVLTGPIARKVRPAYQREFFCGRRLVVELSPPLSGPACAANASYVVGARRVDSPSGTAYPLIQGAAIHSATLNDTSQFFVAQRACIERIDAAIVAADNTGTEVDAFLLVFDQSAAPVATNVPVWSRRMSDLNTATGPDSRLGIDIWVKAWVALSSAPDQYTAFSAGFTNNWFARPWLNQDIIRGNS